ncbi:MAG: hypothetical protein Q8O40_08005 [Chloroflexota bacterium]|nr:hypothetical protein [Chloroflexota bacterium]
MADKKVDPNHKMGKHTGYELRDGKYYLAPTYQQRMDALRARQIGLEDLVRVVSAFAADNYAAIAREQQGWWKEVEDDLALGITAGMWKYSFLDGCISPVEKARAEAQK